MRDGRRTHRLSDMPGSATRSPMVIDSAAAISDSWIVAQKPPIRNLTFDCPCGVVGSITYQPQVLPLLLHPAASSTTRRSPQIFNVLVMSKASMMMQDLVEECAEPLGFRRFEHG